MKTRLLAVLWLLACGSLPLALTAGEWRPQVQERGEAFHGLVFSADGNWALSYGNNTWAARYGSSAIFRLWSVQAEACVWRSVTLPEGNQQNAGQVMAWPVGVLKDRSCVIAWHEYGDNAYDSLRGRWLGMLSPSGKLLWKAEAPDGHPVLAQDESRVGFWDTQNESPVSLETLRLSDRRREKTPVSRFMLPSFGFSNESQQYRATSPENGTGVARLTATKDGKEVWRREVSTENYLVFNTVEPIQGDRLGRWIAWTRDTTLEILEAKTGKVVFRRDGLRENVSVVHPSGAAEEAWLYSAPRKDHSEENPSETMLARVTLDGSSLFTSIPAEGTLCWADKHLVVQDRYLLCANTYGPMAVWCWDLARLSLCWFHEGPGGIWGDGILAHRDGVAFVTWDDGGETESFRLTDGMPIAAESPPMAGTADWPGASVVLALEKHGFQTMTKQHEPLQVTLRDGRSGTLAADCVASSGKWAALSLNDNGLNQTEVLNVDTGYSVSLLVQRNPSHPVEWLAFDKEGRFEGSAGAGRLVAMTQGTMVHPIDQFAATLNRPDQILGRLGTADAAYLESLSHSLDKRRGSLPRGPDAAASQAMPEVTIRSVGQKDGIGTIACDLVPGTVALAAVQVYVNDVPAFGRSGRPVKEPGPMSLDVHLSPARNKLEIECRDTAGGVSARAICHVVNAAPPKSGKLHFVGIGCSDYLHKALPDLSFAHVDALDMQKAFATRTGAPQGTAGSAGGISRTATNAQATRAGVLETLATLADTREEDTVVVFLAGHGCQHEETYYYLPHDADPTSIEATAVSFTEVEEALFRCPARRKLLLLDTCASGQFTADVSSSALSSPLGGASAARSPRLAARSLSGQIPRSSKESGTGWLGGRFSENDLFRRTGTVVLSSCAADEVSLEAAEWQNGAFTEALLKTLNSSEGDRNGDGLLQKQEILYHCREAVAGLLRSLDEPDLRQTPVLDRDNLAEPFALPTIHPTTKASSAISLAEGSLPEKDFTWDGELDPAGVAHGYGTLSTPSGPQYSGRMIRGRFEGHVTRRNSRETSSGTSRSAWRDGARISEWEVSPGQLPSVSVSISPPLGQATPPANPVPPAPMPSPVPVPPVPEVPPMASFGNAGYVWTVNGMLVWNNFPAEDDLAEWRGRADATGFATGAGTLVWYKGRRFVTSYTGTMIRGKLEGETVSQDKKGNQSRVWWQNGKKVRR